jgi:outer membrane protein assembly factor BamB
MKNNFIKMQCSCRPAIVLAGLGCLVLVAMLLSSSAFARRLVSQAEAAQLGLQRAWFAQIGVDSARNRLDRAILHGDRLTVLTSAGVVQELDANTGETLWTAPIGNPEHPTLGPAANDTAVAVINGSTLYVLDATDGRPIVVRAVGGAPGAAPALAKNFVFVPLLTGRVEAYPISAEQKLTPWYYQSYGRAMVAPLATDESVVWATDSGHLYVGNSKDLGVRFRLEADSDILAPPASSPPNVYAATANGDVFAINETTGERKWKYATGFPISRAPAVVDNRVYVTSDEPMLHCIDAESGVGIWEAPRVTQFAAASKTRVYGVDDLGALVMLDAATGTQLARIYRDTATHALVNDQTDRIYLVSEDGLVQCYHELGADQPTYHRPKPAPPTAEGQPSADEAATPSGAAQPQPPAEEDVDEADPTAPADDEADVFGESDEDAEMPAEEEQPAADDVDPFGELEQ